MNSIDYDYLQELYLESDQSYADTAKISGVAVGTVNRIMTTHPSNPGIVSIAGIVEAYGGSLDDLMGIRVRPPVRVPAPIPTQDFPEDMRAMVDDSRAALIRMCEELHTECDMLMRTCDRQERERDVKDRWLRWVFVYAIIATIIALVLALLMEI